MGICYRHKAMVDKEKKGGGNGYSLCLESD